MRIINCTPHIITVLTNLGNVDFPPSGIVPRVKTKNVDLEMTIGTVPLYKEELLGVEGMPDKERYTLYIVSRMVAEHPDNKDRIDLLYPGEQVRNKDGVIVECKNLIVHRDF